MKRTTLLVLAAAAVLGLTAAARPPATPPDDIVFEGGLIVDGTGGPSFRGDVAVRNGKISAVGSLSEARKAAAKRRIDVRALVVTPGFIDLLGQSEYNVLVDNRAASKITQGITTEVTGEGQSIAPTTPKLIAEQEDVWKHYGVRPDWTTLTGYFDAFRRKGAAINLGTFVGLGTVRQLVIGTENRRATTAELEKMESIVGEAMKEGALGVSTSLQYVPDMYNSTGEIIAMARVAARWGGTYFTHQRSEGNRIDSSMEEVFRIAREAHIPANIWHFKTAYQRNWGKMAGELSKIRQARAQGLDVAANQYPWTAAMNGLDACLPPWMREGGRDKELARLKDPALRKKGRDEMLKDSDEWENQYLGSGGPSGVLLTTVIDPSLKKYEGKTIEEIAKEEQKDPVDALMDLVLADKANSYCITFIAGDDDVKAAIRDPWVAFCTDSSAEAEDGILSQEKSHPRGWASTARLLAKYVRDEKVLPLETAVYKMTGLSASRAHIWDRGLLRPGMAADVVALDLANVKVNSTFENPVHYSSGFPYVAVNGALVVDGGHITAARPGRIVLGPGAAR
ncbi:MAG TPA: D-aminoacylase [Thermoanaerobaculia bacterium]|jgi:N-acyl-D-amino-acid deacylase|nr:D-aminoacylase [Thermoanaerobaculia bacterium]